METNVITAPGDAAARNPARRRFGWIKHTLWFLVALGAFVAGCVFAPHMTAEVFTSMHEYGRRTENILEVRNALALIDRNDLDAYRRSTAMRLRNGVIALTQASRYFPCTAREAKTLVDARRYLAGTSDPIHVPGVDVYKDGLGYCDKPETPRPSFSLF